MFNEFQEIADDKEDPSWQKYLGAGAKAKVRAMGDLLKIVTEHVDAQTDVQEFNVLIADKKRLHAIYTTSTSWFKTGGGATDAFVATFKEMQKYLALPPTVEVKWPMCMEKTVFEASIL